MSKQERRDLIDKLVADGQLSADEIINQVAQESGVQPATVRKDVSELYPNLLTEGYDTSEASADETPEAKVVEFESTGNPEMDKGRVTSYTVPEGEENIVHAEIEKVSFARSGATAGRKTSRPTVQKFDIRAWNNFRKNARNLGYSYVKVLHAPEGVDTSVVEQKAVEQK